MYLIEVIPIASGVSKETLSYFSSNSIALGSLVAVPIRKRTIHALVVSCVDARQEKSSIRTSDYSMKKVLEFKSESFLSESFMRAVRSLADFSACSVGGVLNLLVPKSVLDAPLNSKLENLSIKTDTTFDRLALQADDDERLATYRSLIREEFARKHSVFVCLPTSAEVKKYIKILPKGIEDYTFSLYGSLSKSKAREVWSNVLNHSHPVLIIATAPFFSIGRNDIGLIILENESSRSYLSQIRPQFDVRRFAEYFAKEIGVKFIVGDTYLRTETIFRVKSGEISDVLPLKFRLLSPAKCVAVDMTALNKEVGDKFKVLGDELCELIQKSHIENQNIFLFSARRGLATQTVCGDCGSVVLCSRCKTPITLHRRNTTDGNQNFFLCHACGERRGAEERCGNCNSWKLSPLGIGIELIESEIKRKFPSIKVFRVDRDAVTGSKKIEGIVSKFYSSPGSILIGTEMVFPFLDKKIENTAIVSLDSLFSLPDFRIHEKILHILIKIRSLTLSTFLVQTRVPDEKILDYALKGNLIDFYREEIQTREAFNYPPFATFIKITLCGVRSVVIDEMSKLKKFFSPLELAIFPAFSEEKRGVYTMHALIRLQRGVWVEKELLAKLLALPPQFKIAVEPDSLL